MRVSVDGRIYNEKYPTGVTQATNLMLERLIKTSGVNWQIHTHGFSKPNIETFSSLQVHHARPNRINNSLATLNLTNLQKMFGDYDVLWMPNPMFVPYINRPTVITIHDLSVKIWPEFFNLHTRFWYNRWVKNFLQQYNPLVQLATVSERTKKDIEIFYPHWKNNVHHIPIVPPHFYESKHEDSLILREYGIKQPYIMLLSTVEPRKNMRSVYSTFSRLKSNFPALSLVIVGSYLRKIDFQNNSVRFTGYVPSDHKKSLLSQAECVLYPSYYEGYGYPPLEALGAGTPALVSHAGALPEILKDGALYINPNQASIELYKIISQLLSDESMKKELVMKGRKRLQYMHDNFTVEPMIKLLQKCASV